MRKVKRTMFVMVLILFLEGVSTSQKQHRPQHVMLFERPEGENNICWGQTSEQQQHKLRQGFGARNDSAFG